MKRWERTRANGFKRFYAAQALYYSAIVVGGQALYFLLCSRFPTQEELVGIVAAAALAGLLVPLLLWKRNEREYCARLQRNGRKIMYH